VKGAAADNAPLPITTAPSRKLTEPVGFATVVLPVTVAVKVTLCPKTDGLTDDARVVVVVACVTVRGSQLLVAGLLLASPLKVAEKP
jgi:hypothetical protein